MHFKNKFNKIQFLDYKFPNADVNIEDNDENFTAMKNGSKWRKVLKAEVKNIHLKAKGGKSQGTGSFFRQR